MSLRFGSRAFITACALCVSQPARANGEVTANLSAPVGYDSNALLEVNPVGTDAGARGYFAGIDGALGLRLMSHGWEAFAGYDGNHRYSDDFGNLLWHSLELGAGWQHGTTRLEVAWLVVQFMAPQFSADEFIGTGPRGGASWALTDRLRLRVDTGTQARRNDLRTQGYSHASLVLRYLLSAHLSAGVRVQSAWLGNTPVATQPLWQRHRLAPFVSIGVKPWLVWAAPFVGARTLNNETAGQWGGVFSVERTLGQGFAVNASVDLTREWGPQAAGRADRFEGTLALAWRGTHASKTTSAEGDDDVRPVISGRRVRFRLRFNTARKAQLIGSFDGWGPGLPMEKLPGGDDVWEVWLNEAPCGPVRYRFLVDDVPLAPPQAPRYVADGFGGRDGELNVPESVCFKKETAKRVSSRKPHSF
ncbi:MAG: glycogen-binding domain-containing protein [Deltaproteobacteria bacterium]|nr:glycogen-binding domain-containing protein [Deltaproteobacteria bacterium]